MKRAPFVKLALSGVALSLLIAHLIWPELKLDAVTIALLVVMVLPWMSNWIKSVELPGGFKIELQDMQRAGEKISRGEAPRVADSARSEPTYLWVAERDPNLALVGLRMEIEKRLRLIALRNRMPGDQPITRLVESLRKRNIIRDDTAAGLLRLVQAGNQAAHGAIVDPEVAIWATETGPTILAVLDSEIGNASAP